MKQPILILGLVAAAALLWLAINRRDRSAPSTGDGAPKYSPDAFDTPGEPAPTPEKIRRAIMDAIDSAK